MFARSRGACGKGSGVLKCIKSASLFNKPQAGSIGLDRPRSVTCSIAPRFLSFPLRHFPRPRRNARTQSRSLRLWAPAPARVRGSDTPPTPAGRTGGRRKDTGVEVVRRGQAGDLGGARHAEPAHGPAPAPLPVPGRQATVSTLLTATTRSAREDRKRQEPRIIEQPHLTAPRE